MAPTLRDICALLLLLALGLGPPLQSSQAGGMAAKMMTAAGADMPMPDGCDGCGGDDGMNAAACMAACVGSIPAALPVKVLVLAERDAGPDMSFSSVSRGSSGPPDPYPPKKPIVN